MIKRNICVVTSHVPMVFGGHLIIARSLVSALKEMGYNSDVIYTPQNRFGRQLSAYLANRLTDVGRTGAESVDRDLVMACLAADLLKRTDRGLVLSDAGYARFRRSAAEGSEPFRAQHQCRARDLREFDGVQQPVLLNDGESLLGWPRSRKDPAGRPLIGQEQFEAGERCGQTTSSRK